MNSAGEKHIMMIRKRDLSRIEQHHFGVNRERELTNFIASNWIFSAFCSLTPCFNSHKESVAFDANITNRNPIIQVLTLISISFFLGA